MWSVKIRPKPGSTSLAARSFSDVGFVAGWISNFKLIALLPAVGIGAVSGSGVALRACSNETPMAFSRIDALAPRAVALLITPGLHLHLLRSRLPCRHVPQDMLLRKAEVQYVCRNAARQSHGRQIRGPRRLLGLSPAA